MNEFTHKVGSKVKVLHTDFPNKIKVGDIGTVIWSNTAGLKITTDTCKEKLTFYNHEVEPYTEELASNNTQGIEAGDILKTEIGLFTWLAREVDEVEGVKLDDSDKYTPWSYINAKYHIDSKAVKPQVIEPVNNVIEEGDTVEILHKNGASLEVGSHHIVAKSSKSGSTYIIEIEATDKRNNWLYTPESLKLISKAKNNMKQLIGYVLKDAKLQKAVEAITGFNTFDFTDKSRADRVRKGTTCYQQLTEAGVLDLWFEPVYKSEEVIVKLSKSRTATITSKTEGTINVGSEGKFTMQASSVAHAVDAFNKLGQIAGYKVNVNEFNLGCQTFTIADLESVHKAFTDFK